MKMSKPALCCDSCLGIIAREDTRAARLWLDLCTIHLQSNIFGLLIPDDPAIRLLEILGFITTTETSNMIIVKVHHFQNDEDGSYFCGGQCE